MHVTDFDQSEDVIFVGGENDPTLGVLTDETILETLIINNI